MDASFLDRIITRDARWVVTILTLLLLGSSVIGLGLGYLISKVVLTTYDQKTS